MTDYILGSVRLGQNSLNSTGYSLFSKNWIKTFKGRVSKIWIVVSRDTMAEKNLYSGTFQTGDIKYKGCSDQIKDLRRDVMNKEIGDAMIRDVLS